MSMGSLSSVKGPAGSVSARGARTATSFSGVVTSSSRASGSPIDPTESVSGPSCKEEPPTKSVSSLLLPDDRPDETLVTEPEISGGLLLLEVVLDDVDDKDEGEEAGSFGPEPRDEMLRSPGSTTAIPGSAASEMLGSLVLVALGSGDGVVPLLLPGSLTWDS